MSIYSETFQAMKLNFMVISGLVTLAFLRAVPRFGRVLQEVKYE